MNYHYCGGELVEFKLYSEVHKCCGETEDSDEPQVDKYCCSLGSIVLNHGEDHVGGDAIDLLENDLSIDLPEVNQDLVVAPISSHGTLQLARAGPVQKVPSHILHCAPLTYG